MVRLSLLRRFLFGFLPLLMYDLTQIIAFSGFPFVNKFMILSDRTLYYHGSKGFMSVAPPLKFQSDPLCNLAVRRSEEYIKRRLFFCLIQSLFSTILSWWLLTREKQCIKWVDCFWSTERNKPSLNDRSKYRAWYYLFHLLLLFSGVSGCFFSTVWPSTLL